MLRIALAVFATAIDAAVAPLGWDVYATATHGRRGVDRIALVRRPAGAPRPRRLKAAA